MGQDVTFVMCRNLSEARAYLAGAGIYSDRTKHPFPHAILSDLNVGPDSAADLLKLGLPIKDIPVVIMSGTVPLQEDLQAILDSGAREVLTKPMDQRSLVAALSKFIEKYCP